MRIYLIWVVSALVALTQTAYALPVIPGATGFGINTPAGRGGQIIKVTNLDASGSGSLQACISASGPRVCVFEVAGNINLTKDLKIWNPNITIAGQTAPHPGITILGAGLFIRTSDVLIQHLAIRPGDRAEGPDPGNRDALMIAGNSDTGVIKNIVIDHCSFSWSTDEVISSYLYHTNVTIRNSIIAYPLNDSIHPQTPSDGHGHAMSVLIEGDGNIDISGSLFVHARGRNPLSRMSGFVLRNNVIYNWGTAGTQLQGRDSPSRSDIVGNVYIEGADSNGDLPITVGRYVDMVSGSRVFESGNLFVKSDGSISNKVLDRDGASSYMVGDPLFESLSSIASPANADSFIDEVLANAGRRPANREDDHVDSRAVRDVAERTGRLINCVEDDGTTRCAQNAGGWPADSQARITLNLPNQPNGDSDGDGYTNMEEWLQELAASLENGSGATLPPPPTQPLPPLLQAL